MAEHPTIVEQLAAADYQLTFGSLRSLQVEVSSACNLRCPQCFSKVDGHVTKQMTRELWESRIKQHLEQFSDIHLVGIGEPLLNRNFFAFLRDAREAGARTYTTSNLQLVTPQVAERLVTSGLHMLSFSCDGATAETYEAIRRGGRLAQLEKALSALIEARSRHNSPIPSLCLNFGATIRNIHELPDVLLLAKRYNVNTVIAYHNVVYVESNRADSLFYHQALSDYYFSRGAQYCRANGIAFLFPGLFAQPLHYQPVDAYCGYPFSHLYIYSDGRVGPCCMDFPDRIPLGDLRESTLDEVWNGPAIRDLRKQMCSSPSYTCRYCVSHLKMDISDPRYFFRFPGAEPVIDSLLSALTKAS